MKSGYHSFTQNFKECCLNSCCRLAYEQEQESDEYAEAERACEELRDLLRTKLSGEGQLIDRYHESKVRVLAFGDEYIYQQGFQDCIQLMRWLALL